MQPLYATVADIPEIKSLMHKVFNDESAFLDAFFDLKFNKNSVLLCKKKRQICAMAFLLPAQIILHNQLQPATYLYACATHPAYRNQGLMGTILAKAWQDVCANRQVGLFLLPASDMLYHYYKRRAFEPFFYCHKETVTLLNISITPAAYRLQTITAREYNILRIKYLQNDYDIHWDTNHLQLVAGYPEFGSANYYYIIRQDHVIEAIAYILQDNSHVAVTELLTETQNLENIYIAICQHFKISSFSVCRQGNSHPFGVIRLNPAIEINKKHIGYLNFALT